MDDAPDAPQPSVAKQRLLRCMDWLEKQNSQKPVKPSVQKKNDNAERKRFQESTDGDDATVPPGVEEKLIEPKMVPLKKLRKEKLRMECEWQSCQWVFNNYELFQKHVKEHISDLHIIGDKAEYVCLWDVCAHKTSDFREMVRHINYHAYHSHLLAIGFNGRATLKLAQCKKDSTKRNQLPPLKSDHVCMWTGCEDKYHSSIQAFFDHVRQHSNYSEDNLCSWAGCGAKFPRRVLLTMHVRSHTCEKLIACYHCGCHFSCNRKLADHLRRQNVTSTRYRCTVCGACYATDYLLREHARRHISGFACALCDMSAVSCAALAQHVRYKHFKDGEARTHFCPHCDYAAVTKTDLRKHVARHERKMKKIKQETKDPDMSDEENLELEVKKKALNRKYACHICHESEMKIFSRGSRLTSHMVKVHGAQWPSGHSRFRYHLCEDGMYRLTTTRFEFLDVSKKIVDGYSWPKEKLTSSFEFNVELKSEPTTSTPMRFEITLKNGEVPKIEEESIDINNDTEILNKDNEILNNDHGILNNDYEIMNNDHEILNNDYEILNSDYEILSDDHEVLNNDNEIENTVEIEMLDIDDKGNIIKSNVINSEIVLGM